MDTHFVSGGTAQPTKTPASAQQRQLDTQGQSILHSLRSHRKALTVPAVADLLGCSSKSIYALVKQKRLPALRIGASVRIDPFHLAQWLEAHSTAV
jgi:excisionase family DNA binding protein